MVPSHFLRCDEPKVSNLVSVSLHSCLSDVGQWGRLCWDARIRDHGWKIILLMSYVSWNK